MNAAPNPSAAAAASAPKTITLAGGCFWCTEAVFREVQGVQSVVSGYANGHLADPSYEQVCSGRSGHAEAVQVRFDPAAIALADILAIFFGTHDPTTLNRQGHDVGPQYRSGVYWSDPADEAEVRRVFADVQAELGGRAVTELQPLTAWYPAEAEHQDYHARHPMQGYCMAVIEPKLAKFRRVHAAHLRRG